VAAVALIAVIGVSVGFGLSSSTTTTTATPTTTGSTTTGGATNARSGPAEGGSIGTVSGTSDTGFTITTTTGQPVPVTVSSATTYQNAVSLDELTAGESVLALGITDGTTITASVVVVEPPAGSGENPGGTVVSFQRGVTGADEQVGQIPANYTEGEGTIVSGATADEVTEAVLAAYPGGVVDRVVQLSDGEFNVHYVGVNWPHHVFVDQSFQVVGAL